jgi:hypothetical protein
LTGIQPPDTGARRCQSESFHICPFPLGRKRSSERPGAVKGAPIGAAKRTLDGEDRSYNPAFYELDFGLHKNFALLSEAPEARYLQFRAEGFSLLNKTNFSPAGTLTSNSSGFGVFSSTFPARQVQLALKLIF